jgi:hypothetical protein
MTVLLQIKQLYIWKNIMIEKFIRHTPKQPNAPHGQDFILLQDKLDRTLSGITDSTVVDGILIENIALTTSTTDVQHMLGKQYRGYIIVYQDAAETIYVDSSSTANKSLYISLKASGNVNISLWMF